VAKDQYMASKHFLDFIRDFTKLTEMQLDAIRAIVGQSITEIMGSVQSINTKAESQKQKADEVLIKGDEANFRSASMKDVLDKEQDAMSATKSDEERKELLANRLRRAGGKFSKEMEAMSTLDDEIKGVLLCVMGSVSNDDVVKQRLDHIIASLQEFNRVVGKVIEGYATEMNLKNVQGICTKLVTQIYKSYSSEEEREIFHKVFGKPKVKAA
jgi:hypothetical protein